MKKEEILEKARRGQWFEDEREKDISRKANNWALYAVLGVILASALIRRILGVPITDLWAFLFASHAGRGFYRGLRMLQDGENNGEQEGRKDGDWLIHLIGGVLNAALAVLALFLFQRDIEFWVSYIRGQ